MNDPNTVSGLDATELLLFVQVVFLEGFLRIGSLKFSAGYEPQNILLNLLGRLARLLV